MTNHELAKRYKEKELLLGKEVLKIILLDNDNVMLDDVIDKESTGRIVIPGFITCMKLKVMPLIGGYGPLDGCNYTEVYVENKKGRDLDCKYLCAGMKSDELDIVFKNPEYISDLSGLCYDNGNMTRVNIRGLDRNEADFKKVKDLNLLFSECKLLKTVDLRHLRFGKLHWLSDMFSGCEKLVDIKFGDMDASDVITTANMFNSCEKLKVLDLSCLNLKKIENTILMFYDCKELESVQFNKEIDTSNLKDMKEMFSNCKKLKSLDLSMFNTINVEDMEGLFMDCSELSKLDIHNFSTMNVKSMKHMFLLCKKLKSLDLSMFNTIKVDDIQGMFMGCSELEGLNIHNFNTSKVKNMMCIFADCKALKKIDIDELDMSMVRDISLDRINYITGGDNIEAVKGINIKYKVSKLKTIKSRILKRR